MLPRRTGRGEIHVVPVKLCPGGQPRRCPKKTPVSSSHRTPDARATGPHMAWPKRLPSRWHRNGPALAPPRGFRGHGRRPVARPAGPVRAAASAARHSALPACLAPNPSARPNRTLSMPASVNGAANRALTAGASNGDWLSGEITMKTFLFLFAGRQSCCRVRDRHAEARRGLGSGTARGRPGTQAAGRLGGPPYCCLACPQAIAPPPECGRSL